MPSSQMTGSIATSSARMVRLTEREYSHSSTAVMMKARPKKLMTVVRPSITSPSTLAKPTMLISTLSLPNWARMASNFLATSL